MLWLLEMAVLNTDTQSERITRQGLTCVYGLWLTVLQELYLNNGKILLSVTKVVGYVPFPKYPGIFIFNKNYESICRKLARLFIFKFMQRIISW